VLSKTSVKWTALCGLVCMWTQVAPLFAANSGHAARGFELLFNLDKTNGVNPLGIVQGTDGNFYGIAPTGGANGNDEDCGQGVGCGTVFKVGPTGGLTALYNFCALSNCADGALPVGSLALGTDGNLYGVTNDGGSNNVCFFGCGTVFRLTLAGSLTTLYSFCTQTGCLDGRAPSSIVLGTDGNFYGTTSLGGGSAACKNGCGTIFQLTPTGKLTTIYSFCALANCADGTVPNPVIQASDGNLYGTTQAGGANDGGTVFKMTTSGALTTLYSFCSQANCDDGGFPMAGLVQASNGKFYGTTYAGGSQDEGTAFKITASGQLTTLYTFCMQTNCPSGGNPGSSLIQATDGNFYGTTIAGAGTCFIEVDCGTIFRMTPTGQLATIFTFCTSNTTCNEARAPGAALVQGTDGNIYGTTVLGGNNTICSPYGCGSFFRLVSNFGPFVGFVNRAGQVGTEVEILGQGLDSANAVSFNGVPAQFKVQSNTFLTATVPTGASSGTVTVAIAAGSLKSNVAFQVLP